MLVTDSVTHTDVMKLFKDAKSLFVSSHYRAQQNILFKLSVKTVQFPSGCPRI